MKDETMPGSSMVQLKLDVYDAARRAVTKGRAALKNATSFVDGTQDLPPVALERTELAMLFTIAAIREAAKADAYIKVARSIKPITREQSGKLEKLTDDALDLENDSMEFLLDKTLDLATWPDGGASTNPARSSKRRLMRGRTNMYDGNRYDTYDDFIADKGLEVRIHEIPERPNGSDWLPGSRHFEVSILRPERRRGATVFYSQGPGVRGEPRPSDVLHAVALDQAAYTNFENPENIEYEYGVDRKKAKSIFAALVRAERELSKILDSDEIEELIYGIAEDM